MKLMFLENHENSTYFRSKGSGLLHLAMNEALVAAMLMISIFALAKIITKSVGLPLTHLEISPRSLTQPLIMDTPELQCLRVRFMIKPFCNKFQLS